MQLTPRLPPGRKSRKALAFADEIRRLRALGYTNEAIQQALADAGVKVSRSTVHREATRPITAGSVATATNAAARSNAREETS
jgi:hypothetical protein